MGRQAGTYLPVAPQLRRLQDHGQRNVSRWRRAELSRGEFHSDLLQRPRAAGSGGEVNSGWTPTVIVEDAEGREHRRRQGYLDPKRFVGELALARLKDAIDRRDFGTACERSRSVLKQTEGDTARRPESLYWYAVAAYRVSGDRDDLIEGWNGLLERFPRSEWAKCAGYIHKQ
jgi:hypothetical protein